MIRGRKHQNLGLRGEPFKQLLKDNFNYLDGPDPEGQSCTTSESQVERLPTTKMAIFIQTKLSYKLRTVKLKHTCFLQLLHDGDQYNTVLVALAIPYDEDCYDTVLVALAIPYDGNLLLLQHCTVQWKSFTILYLLVVSIDGDQYNAAPT